MSIKINYSKKTLNKPLNNLVLFSNDVFNIKSLEKHLSTTEYEYIKDLLKTCDLKKNLFVYELNSKKKIIIISIKNKLKISDIENLGGEFYERINYGKNSEYFIFSDTINNKEKDFIGYFLHGAKLKSYKFHKYKTKKENRQITINVLGTQNITSVKNQSKFKALEEGTFFS